MSMNNVRADCMHHKQFNCKSYHKNRLLFSIFNLLTNFNSVANEH